MYIPRAFRYDDRADLLAFMQVHSFITLVSLLDNVPVASHIPVVVRQDGETVSIHGHLARANPQWQAFAHGESLAIFAGPHAYISPTLYDAHESVPTWNYIAVHATGPVRTLHAATDGAELAAEVQAIIATYEASYAAQWDALSERYRAGMLNGIVGFVLTATRLEGKAKLSQNKSTVEQHRIAAALHASDDPAAQATGAAMVVRASDAG